VFTSTYDCKIDDKGRVSLPGKLKSELMPVLADGFILKRSVFSPCLELWPKQEWDKKLASINELTRFNRKNAKVVRSFLAGVKSVEFDSSGRLNIPNDLMAFAGIEKTVVIASQISIIEIWDKTRYEQEVEIVNDDNYAQLVEEVLGSLDSNQKQ
jgi:MraZ protein